MTRPMWLFVIVGTLLACALAAVILLGTATAAGVALQLPTI